MGFGRNAKNQRVCGIRDKDLRRKNLVDKIYSYRK